MVAEEVSNGAVPFQEANRSRSAKQYRIAGCLPGNLASGWRSSGLERPSVIAGDRS